ncbi:cytochrome c [Granulicella sp. WH15]|uniref:c-type cytochrome n=1 Tax=Granulicella sp. WH15 TaxID=2602070 RepID=UPI00136755FB|nr:cytochrome c [Granulicella sp. WH15]QHN02567.1 cytochrome c [Granulicella sp. WH15]
MFVKRLPTLCIALLATGVFYSQPPVHAAPGAALYSTAQSDRGKALYAKQCTSCHSADLGGVGQAPPLVDNEFLSKYTDQPIFVLFNKIQKTMPATAPGSLTPSDTADVLAYILSANSFPAGATDLPSTEDALQKTPLTTPAK